LPIAVAWEAGCGGAGGWLQTAIAMPWEAGFGRWRWRLTLLAAATLEAGCVDTGSWLPWQQLKEGRWLKVIDGKE
jgi:hypothetical protein